MLKSFYEEAIALVALALFILTIYVWAQIIDSRVRAQRAGEADRCARTLLISTAATARQAPCGTENRRK